MSFITTFQQGLTPRIAISLVLLINMAWNISSIIFQVIKKQDVDEVSDFDFSYDTIKVVTWIELIIFAACIIRINKPELPILTYAIAVLLIDTVLSAFFMLYYFFEIKKGHLSSHHRDIESSYLITSLFISIFRISSASIIYLNKIEAMETLENQNTLQHIVSYCQEANCRLHFPVQGISRD